MPESFMETVRREETLPFPADHYQEPLAPITICPELKMALARITRLNIIESSNNTFERFYQEFRENVDEVEPDVLRHVLCKSGSDMSEYILYEEYASEEAMSAHGRTPHFNSSWTKMGRFIVGSPQTEVMEIRFGARQ